MVLYTNKKYMSAYKLLRRNCSHDLLRPLELPVWTLISKCLQARGPDEDETQAEGQHVKALSVIQRTRFPHNPIVSAVLAHGYAKSSQNCDKTVVQYFSILRHV